MSSGTSVKAIVAGALLATGCGEPRPEPAPSVASEEVAPVSAATLWKTPVTSASFARRTLYTWTTDAQIAELRATRVLLSREESPERGASYFEQVLHALASRSPIARLLDTTTFAKSRFAWPAPWATREGWDGEQYGEQLIRVTLAPDAIVLALSTATGAFAAAGLDGAPIAATEVIAHPERIGAVYFVVDREQPVAAGLPPAPGVYREYVLPNESMIQRWSVGTTEIADELAANAAALETLAHSLKGHSPTAEVVAGFASALAFDNPSYALASAPLATIARHLRETPRPAPLENGARVAFPGIGAPRNPPRVVPRNRGTYGSF